MLPPLLLTACATPGTPKTADSACLAFRLLTYAIAPMQADGSRAMAEDPGNRHDTTETVAQAQEHNARFRAVCPERGR
jgi:hypothetical protein